MRRGPVPDPRSCVSDEEMALMAEGAVGADRRRALLMHLADCEECLLRWTSVAEDEAIPAAALATLRPAGAFFRIGRRRALAAAAALLAGVGIALYVGGWIGPGRPARGPAGTPIRGVDEAFSVAAGEPERALILPDGSRFRVRPGTDLRFIPPGSGERAVAWLERGSVDVEAAKDRNRLRIASRAGDITVVGTAFRARALRVASGKEPWEDHARSVLSVEVSEGAVRLSRGEETMLVPAGRRGLLMEGRSIILQEMGSASWETALREWNRAGRPREDLSMVFLLATSWPGLDDWEDLLDKGGLDPAVRSAAADLWASGLGPEECERLSARYAREGEVVQVSLLPHVARLLGIKRDDFLRQESLSGSSQRVREMASRLLQASGVDAGE